MTRRTKTLEKLIGVRQRIRDRRAAETAAAEQILERAQSEDDEARRGEHAFFAGVEELEGAPISAATLLEIDRVRGLWARRVEETRRRVAEREAETERRRQHLRSAAHDLRVTERAHERVSSAEEKKKSHEEQRLSDDLAARRVT
jgi:flagellar export protein FliJ